MHGRKKSDVPRTKEELEALSSKAASYRKVMATVVANRRAGADDPEAMDLLAKVLRLNPDAYTIWNYRREAVLKQMSLVEADAQGKEKLVEDELFLTAQAIKRNPKSYAAWHHRRWALNLGGLHPDALDRELDLCTQLLEMDARNFHCWRHRMWVARLRRLPVEEDFAFTGAKIAQNFSNCSALHHRSNLLPSIAANRSTEEQRWQLLRDELEMVRQAVYTEPADQSPWWYHRFLLSWAARGCPAAVNQSCTRESCGCTGRISGAGGAAEGERGAEDSLCASQAAGEGSSSCGSEDHVGGNGSMVAGAEFEEILRSEAQSLRELLELDEEEGGKWPSLALLSILSYLRERQAGDKAEADGWAAESAQLLERLRAADPMHARRYMHLKETLQ